MDSITEVQSGGGNAALPSPKPKAAALHSRKPKGAADLHSRKPKGSKFFQQEMQSYSLHMTPKRDILVFVLIGVIFIPIGVACLLASQSVVEIIDQYDTVCIPDRYKNDKVGFIKNAAYDKSCTRIITVEKNMTQPVYVYYQLEKFYQMHPRYFTSRSYRQLKNLDGENDTESCKHEAKTADNQTIVPCGLIAWSMFNDTFTFVRSHDNKKLPVNKTGIAWPSDKDKFGDNVYPKNFQRGLIQGGAKLNESIPLNQQEDLIVWMRPAALPSFRKLYGRIEEDLGEGDTIVVTIQNNYNTYAFDGSKKLVLSTTSWIGGKNDFLGIAFLTVGVFCLVLALVYISSQAKDLMM